MEIEYKISDLESVAQKIIKEVKNKIILFHGSMGAGKTTLIKALAKQLGVMDEISSPTFSLVNEYEAENTSIYHFDFYRIEDETEALDMGVEEYFSQDAWIFIEWPQKIENLLPETAQTIEISIIDEETRMLKFC